MIHFYRKISQNREDCFNVDIEEKLSQEEKDKLIWLLAETFEPENFKESSFFNFGENVVEIGPRLNFATPFSTNAVAICHSCGLDKVKRVEKSRRYKLSFEEDKTKFIVDNHDRMTECEYPQSLKSFESDIVPEKVFTVRLIEKGISALEKINKDMGLGMDDWDIKFYHDLFVNYFKRNPTNVECFQLGQANSEHSRHWFFKGKLIIDGQEMLENLFTIVKSTWKANSTNSVIAFSDNSSAIIGNKIKTILPKYPGLTSPFNLSEQIYHLVFTAETHNFPCAVAPFPGGETGTGGRIRDVQATGRGALVVAGTAGFCTGNLNIPDYEIAGEDRGKFTYPNNLALPLKIMLNESSGAFDYGNKFGEPCIQGFTRTFGMELANGERREWLKPIMFTGGVGQISDKHLKKEDAKENMLIVQIGGPAYRIGMGGGAASSMIGGQNKAELDFNAVQRGDAEMEQKMNRLVRACVEMGDNNPILSIHDQGAGGPCNVLTELVAPVGGRVDICKIIIGDKTMSVLEIWGAEYQERNALLIGKNRIEQFKNICGREKVTCEVLGEVKGDGKIIVCDSADNSTPVDLELEKILGDMPQKIFTYERAKPILNPLVLPENLKIEEAVKKIFSLPSVGSKGYLVRKVDRSVTGLITRQQCCGPLQLPVSNVSVIAQSHFSNSGAAIAIGEQPIKMLVDEKAGARMAVGEMLTNMVWAAITSIQDIKCSLNWMWAAKLPNEGAVLYDAAIAARDLMIKLGVAVDGGKDSLSMAAKVNGDIVKAPGEMVVSGYVGVSDINKVITPDIKKPGSSKLMFIDLANGKNRLGGSALAQAHGQIGDTCSDMEDANLLVNAFNAVQEMIKNNLILAGHDISDGGLVTTLSEMAMAGNCGLDVKIFKDKNVVAQLFAEELGLVIEYEDSEEMENKINKILQKYKLKVYILGNTAKEKKVIIRQGELIVFSVETNELLKWWEATSDRLEEMQINPVLAKEQAQNHIRLSGPKYELTFSPEKAKPELLSALDKPKVAILREEGSNGDREMTSAFFMTGFEPWDVTMSDLLDKKVSLDEFRGLIFVGGFSYADVLDSAKGWAGKIKFNSDLRDEFNRFYNRPDTFSLGVCNGCQLMALLGWVPKQGITEAKQPRFIRNKSGRFESRWVNVKILESPAIMLKDMAGSSLGVWVAHGEGYLHCPDANILADIKNKNLTPLVYVDDNGEATEKYPYNPNSSPCGITALCSPDGRHLAMMPHPERAFLKWQWPYMPEDWKKDLPASPWLKMFQNAREWC